MGMSVAVIRERMISEFPEFVFFRPQVEGEIWSALATLDQYVSHRDAIAMLTRSKCVREAIALMFYESMTGASYYADPEREAAIRHLRATRAAY
jgi:hypothetical protein